MFKPVTEIDEGGQGIPVPTYPILYGGEVLHVARNAKEALGYLSGRGPGFVVTARIDGMAREVCRT